MHKANFNDEAISKDEFNHTLHLLKTHDYHRCLVEAGRAITLRNGSATTKSSEEIYYEEPGLRVFSSPKNSIIRVEADVGDDGGTGNCKTDKYEREKFFKSASPADKASRLIAEERAKRAKNKSKRKKRK